MKFNFITFVLISLSVNCYSQSIISSDSIYPPADLIVPYHSEWTKKHYTERINEFKITPLEQNDIVFLGNSITEYGGDWGQRFNLPIVKNRGIAGDVTEGVLQRLREIYYFHPSSVFLLIGINDLFIASVSAENVASNIVKIVSNIHDQSPLTKIYIQTILPTLQEYMVEKIKTTNDYLKDKAKSADYILIDLHVLFANEQDLIKKEYTTDGIHLSEDGYKLWSNYIEKYVKQLK